MSANVAIPIAGFKDVYEVSAVEKALQELPPTANEALRALYEKMVRLGGQRFTVKPSTLPAMEQLFEELPNFTEVLADIRKHLALCIDSEDSIELPPMLLLGEPGIGKTHFARKVAELLDAHDWGKQFPENPAHNALEKLACLPPREMRRALHAAFGDAKLAGRSEISPDDIKDARTRRQRIGF